MTALIPFRNEEFELTATPQVRVTAKGLHRLRELLTPQPALEVVA